MPTFTYSLIGTDWLFPWPYKAICGGPFILNSIQGRINVLAYF
jgi:hypothetical protein